MRRELQQSFEADRAFLWAFSYRMTGDPSEADDVVQETFVRAMEHAPATDRPLRPWLTRVAANLAVDRLRQRQARPYPGPWLPSVVATDEPAERSPADHYELVESATLAFLFALETLTPAQRAVLLLREVFELSVEETAAALELSESNVKTTHHRARAALKSYDAERQVPTREVQERHREMLERFVAAIAQGDLAALSELLAPEAQAIADGAGRFAASRTPITGAARVARLYQKLAQRPLPFDAELRMVNGLPALVTRFFDPPGKNSPQVMLQPVLGPDGRIARIYSQVVPEKLARLAG